MPHPSMHGAGCCDCAGGTTVDACSCAVPTTLHGTVQDEEASSPWVIGGGHCDCDTVPFPRPQRTITYTYRAKVGTDPAALPAFFWASDCIGNGDSCGCHCPAYNGPDPFGFTPSGPCSLMYYLYCQAGNSWRYRVASWSAAGCTGTLVGLTDQYAGTLGIAATSCSPFLVGSAGQLVSE